MPAEILLSLDQPEPEEAFPDAVDVHPSGQRIVLIHDPLGQGESIGLDRGIEFVEEALDGTRASQHLLGNPVINFDGERAVVRTDLQATEYYRDTKKAKTTVWGFYETHMVKDKNWKITRHILTSIGSE